MDLNRYYPGLAQFSPYFELISAFHPADEESALDNYFIDDDMDILQDTKGDLLELDICGEEMRVYLQLSHDKTHEVAYIIDHPVKLYFRPKGTTHRILDAEGIVHIVPAPGHGTFAIKYLPKNAAEPVRF